MSNSSSLYHLEEEAGRAAFHSGLPLDQCVKPDKESEAGAGAYAAWMHGYSQTHWEYCQWLQSFMKKGYVQPVFVTLGNFQFFGARWRQTLEYSAGMACVQDGRHQVGEPYENDRIDLLGQVPHEFKRRRKFCFPFEGLDWYISHHYEKEKNEHQPFGKTFGLCPWDIPGTTIDQYEPKLYLRVSMRVEYISLS